jgi:hypothetical protein
LNTDDQELKRWREAFAWLHTAYASVFRSSYDGKWEAHSPINRMSAYGDTPLEAIEALREKVEG